MTIAEAHRQKFAALVGDAHVITDPEALKPLGKDWTYLTGQAACAVFPKSREEVAAILRYCSQHQLAVVPSGGRTGLAGGAVAANGEVVLSLARMNKVLSIDTIGMSITAEAGVLTQTLQEKALEAGLFYPVDLASKGSCQLGGNIATNAGGLKLIRFGGTRDNVLGLEVVLANGEILDLDFNLKKDNSGYDLKQLFISSEGTLGVITKATMRLVHKPKEWRLHVLGCEKFDSVLEILRACNLRGIQPGAFEYLTRPALDVVLAHHQSVRDPFAAPCDFYVLLETERSSSADDERMAELLEEALDKGWAQDAVIAETSSEFKALWGMRENISESVAMAGQVRKNDITVPICSLATFHNEVTAILKKAPPFVKMILFGHIGDGNIHLNYTATRDVAAETFHKAVKGIEGEIFRLIAKLRGSISAEHGIGLIKKEDLKFTRTPDQIEMMRRIKKVFDPAGIMNPGKIF